MQIAAPVLLVAVFIVTATVHFDIRWHLEGLFLLRDTHGHGYRVKDDLYLGDGGLVLCGLDFGAARTALAGIMRRLRGSTDIPSLDSRWDAYEGTGYFRNYLPGGRQVFTSFGRFADEEGRSVRGLFLGGGVPESVVGNMSRRMNQSGMAYFDGARWYHVWCSINEGIVSLSGEALQPSLWKFLGSRVIESSDRAVVLTSSHQVTVDGVPLSVDRSLSMEAGKPYFVLAVKVTNIGDRDAGFHYVYGDEPWIGNYGSSSGTVGWVTDGIIEHEMVLDSSRYNFAGMFHYGNSAIGEGHDFSRTASFIEWFGEEKPDVFFANDAGGVTGRNLPLSSNTRYIGLQWGNQSLRPGQSKTYKLAVGMAGIDPSTGFPVKPVTQVNHFPLDPPVNGMASPAVATPRRSG